MLYVENFMLWSQKFLVLFFLVFYIMMNSQLHLFLLGINCDENKSDYFKYLECI